MGYGYLAPGRSKPRGYASALLSGPSPLLPGLLAYYKLDEESGTRADSVGSADLADTGSTLSESGLIGRCAGFVAASTQSLIGSVAANRSGKSWFISVWVRVTSSPSGGQNFFSTSDPTSGKGIDIAINSSKELNWRLWTGGNFYIGNFDASLTNNIWHLVTVAYNAATSELVTWLDAASKKTTGSIVTIQTEPTVTIALGLRPSFGGTEYFDGLVDECGHWLDRFPSDAEVAALYNGGLGTTYPEF